MDLGGPPEPKVEPSRRLSGDLLPFAWATLGPLAATKVLFQLLTANLYGAHRDEFYYLVSGHHLAWGYVDNPPLVPVVYRLQEIVFGHSVRGLAVVPALLGGAYVILGGLLAREVGGGRFAQILTGTVAWVGTLYLTTSHFLSTVSFDLLFWALGSLLVTRMVRTDARRLWVPIGAVCGVGMLNKYTMVFWIVGVAVGLLLTPQRRVLASWWLPLGGALAAVMAAPNLAWQVSHRWPTWQFLRNIRASGGHRNLVQFVPEQLLLVTLVGTVIWITALVVMSRSEWRDQRWLLFGYGTVFIVLLTLAGKPYYLGSWYLPIVAIGSVAVERGWRRATRNLLFGGVVATGLLLAPYATPILPQATAVNLHLDTANSDLGGMMGWPTVVRSVAVAYKQLPPDEQMGAVILTDNYSQAGAVDFYGSPYFLPGAISGQNSFWMWGYGRPASDATVVAVGLSSGVVHKYWASVVRVGAVGGHSTPIDPQERGASIWICRHQRVSWAGLWTHLRHYD